MTMEDFKKYFKLPLVLDDWGGIVWTEDYNRAFDFLLDDKNSQKNTVDKLNGDFGKKVDGKLTYKDSYVMLDGENIISIRSWGRLTGTGGGLGLKPDKASNIQDEFGEWIIKTLKE